MPPSATTRIAHVAVERPVEPLEPARGGVARHAGVDHLEVQTARVEPLLQERRIRLARGEAEAGGQAVAEDHDARTARRQTRVATRQADAGFSLEAAGVDRAADLFVSSRSSAREPQADSAAASVSASAARANGNPARTISMLLGRRELLLERGDRIGQHALVRRGPRRARSAFARASASSSVRRFACASRSAGVNAGPLGLKRSFSACWNSTSLLSNPRAIARSVSSRVCSRESVDLKYSTLMLTAHELLTRWPALDVTEKRDRLNRSLHLTAGPLEAALRSASAEPHCARPARCGRVTHRHGARLPTSRRKSRNGSGG